MLKEYRELAGYRFQVNNVAVPSNVQPGDDFSVSVNWSNVGLTRCDAAVFTPPQPIQAALFTLSYCTMRDRSAILRRAWNLLEPGGRAEVVVPRHRAPPFIVSAARRMAATMRG